MSRKCHLRKIKRKKHRLIAQHSTLENVSNEFGTGHDGGLTKYWVGAGLEKNKAETPGKCHLTGWLVSSTTKTSCLLGNPIGDKNL